MPNLEGEKVIFAVAQMPFEHSGDSDVINLFGTLAPVVMSDGDEVDESDFPNAGLVWWMLRPGIRSSAVPGRLLKGVLEPARRYDSADPRSQYYQVHRDSVAPVEAEDLLEIISVAPDIAQEPRDLINGDVIKEMNRPASAVVLVRWRGQILGPFRANSNGEGVVYRLRLTTARSDQTVTTLEEREFNQLVGAARIQRQIDVSISDVERGRAGAIMKCDYDLLVGPAKASFGRPEHHRLKLESDVDIIKRVAKRLMPRRDRQALTEALERLRIRSDEAGAEVSIDERRALEAIARQQNSTQAEMLALANALIDSGFVTQQLLQAIDARTTSYVQDNLARLQAQVRERMAEETSRLERLQAEAEHVQAALDDRKTRAYFELEQELAKSRAEAEHQIRIAMDEATRIRQDQHQLQERLESVVKHLQSERAAVIADVMTTLAVLSESPKPAVPQSAASADAEPVATARALTFPAFVTAPAPRTQPDEAAFFERFRAHVEASGYQYRPIDLISFHLSVKCGDITILGGLSGVGKSSLPRLYADALAGESAEARDRYREVSVSPSWLDMRDLLGYVNTLDRRFQPTESGLYQHLIFAHEEFAAKGMEAGICMVNLDEMNLAQVEHYFSGFLQALERIPGQRRVACFSSSSVSSEEPFVRWAELDLPPTVRFIGTVNLDETTKQLSLRLLDRANFIRLRPHLMASAGMGLPLGGPAMVQGPSVTFRTLREWIRPPQLPQDLAVVWDEIRRALADLGTVISPRRQNAIELFVASARDITTPESALDVQVTQRVLPQLRGAFTESTRDSLSQLTAIFERREGSFPETVRALHEMMDALAQARLWA